MNSFAAWIGNCILRDDRSGALHQSTVVVWADGYATYRSGVEAEILHRDLTLVRLENVSPACEDLNDTSPQFSALVPAVHSGNPVEMGTLEPFARTDDQQSYLSLDEFPVEPLDRQSDVWPMKNVPDALYDPLFGQPAPTEAEIAHYGGVEYVPPMKTYAILDAGKFQSGLSEFEDCGLPFRCLFKGDAAEEQKDVAPYLFELSPDSPFVRRLFSHLPDMPETMTTVHMWHHEPGIYLRSRAGFDDVWKHFRKFTRVRDKSGGWIYYRFWEAGYLVKLVQRKSRTPSAWLWRMFEGIHSTLFLHRNTAKILKIPKEWCAISQNLEIRIEDIIGDLSAIKLDIFCKNITEILGNGEVLKFLGKAEAGTEEKVRRLVVHARDLGFREERSIERYILSCHITNNLPERDPRAHTILKAPQHELDKSRRLLMFALNTLEI
ncbi:DUF4123 domain-containing protein [Celeribacter ethanolicus]|uniref:DUF4123 domain-containing protein n=1 Tax=Celeribacter ethanolicus TaxID=1758178 RepID=UPI0009D6DA63|nr:DUF4123 domain-containing protein [Celeribacter ethanolicus]